MAQRRMFSIKIVESDDFLDMPISAQALYFHLGMYADDDGFTSPKKVMRILGSVEDDIKLLIAKRFIIPFQSGVVVVKHWNINNQIRQDRYTETSYQEEKKQLYLKENSAYTLDVNQMVTIGKPSIVKDSIVKDSKEKKSDDFLFEVKRLREWNSNQSSSLKVFKPENIVNKHGVEKVRKLREKFGSEDNGFSLFLKGLNKI